MVCRLYKHQLVVRRCLTVQLQSGRGKKADYPQSRFLVVWTGTVKG